MALLKKKNLGNDKVLPPKHIQILIFDGRVTIADYTHNDEYRALLSSLSRCGIQQDIQTESWCG
jgi:hypothetical protein